jgi:hypothetical protein
MAGTVCNAQPTAIRHQNREWKMKGKLTILRPGKKQEIVEMTSPLRLQLMNDIAGGDIEQIPYWSTYEGEECVVFGNTNAKMNKLQVNKSANADWHDARVREGIKGKPEDELRGPIVIVTGDAEFMETV